MINHESVIEALGVAVLICYLLILDIITKWVYLANKYNKEQGYNNNLYNLFRAICFRGWTKGYFESSKLNVMLIRKIIPYTCLITVAVLVQGLPDVKFNGIQADTTISFSLYCFIVLCEFYSIAENLKNLGFTYGAYTIEMLKQLSMKLIGTAYKKEE